MVLTHFYHNITHIITFLLVDTGFFYEQLMDPYNIFSPDPWQHNSISQNVSGNDIFHKSLLASYSYSIESMCEWNKQKRHWNIVVSITISMFSIKIRFDSTLFSYAPNHLLVSEKSAFWRRSQLELTPTVKHVQVYTVFVWHRIKFDLCIENFQKLTANPDITDTAMAELL